MSAKSSSSLLWYRALIQKWVEGGVKGTLLCFWMTSVAKCVLLHKGRECCFVCSSQLLTWPSLVSLRHLCGPTSSVNCRTVWGCARPLSDHSIMWLQMNVYALPMNYFWMTFSTKGTPFGRWVTRVNRQLWNQLFYFVSKQYLLRPTLQKPVFLKGTSKSRSVWVSLSAAAQH